MSKTLKRLANSLFLRNIQPYIPAKLEQPAKTLNINSAWKGHALIIADIIERFGLKTDKCLEFGVEFGYSAVTFSNYFKSVKGIDTFMGDIHTAHKGDHYDQTRASLAAYPNIELIRSDYRDWIAKDTDHYNLIHVDIVHTYEHTYACGLWSAQHSDCTIFHDTESFPDVKRAVHDIARKTGKTFYNYKPHYGLGIIV